MNFIAGYLIIITKDEEKSFWLMDALLAKMLPGILMDLHEVNAAKPMGKCSHFPCSCHVDILSLAITRKTFITRKAITYILIPILLNNII